MSDDFDVHSAFRRRDQHRSARRTIDHNPQIQLAGNVETLLDQQRADLLAFFAGLNRDQRIAQHPSGVGFRFVRRADQYDAALIGLLLEAALTASARVNLRLHDGDRAAQLREGRSRLIGDRKSVV